MQPITREEYEDYLIPMKATKAVRQTTEFLLTMLFKPDKELGYVVDRDRLRLYLGPGDALINYGGLHCTYIEEQNGVFHVHIEEASPEAHHLKNYLKRWFEDFGWPVEIEIKW